MTTGGVETGGGSEGGGVTTGGGVEVVGGGAVVVGGLEEGVGTDGVEEATFAVGPTPEQPAKLKTDKRITHRRSIIFTSK